MNQIIRWSSIVALGSTTTYECRKGINVCQKSLGESHDVFSFALGEVVFFMSSSVAVEAYLFGPVGHVRGDFSIGRQLLKSLFKLPSLIHRFGGEVQCSTTKKDCCFEVSSLKVFDRLTKSGLNFFRAVLRDREAFYDWVISVDRHQSISVEVDDNMSVSRVQVSPRHASKLKHHNFTAVIALCRNTNASHCFYPLTREENALCLTMSAFLTRMKSCHKEVRPDSLNEVESA